MTIEVGDLVKINYGRFGPYYGYILAKDIKWWPDKDDKAVLIKYIWNTGGDQPRKPYSIFYQEEVEKIDEKDLPASSDPKDKWGYANHFEYSR